MLKKFSNLDEYLYSCLVRVTGFPVAVKFLGHNIKLLSSLQPNSDNLMFRDPKYFKQFECPSVKENRKCENVNCIFSHIKKTEGDDSIASTVKSSSTSTTPSKVHSLISPDSDVLSSGKDMSGTEQKVEVNTDKLDTKEGEASVPKATASQTDKDTVQPNHSRKIYPKEKHHKVVSNTPEEVKAKEVTPNKPTSPRSDIDLSSNQSRKRPSTDQSKQVAKKQQTHEPIEVSEILKVDEKPDKGNEVNTKAAPGHVPTSKTKVEEVPDQISETSIKPITQFDISNDERLANIESFLKFLKQNKQLAINKEFKIIQSCKSLEEYRARVKNLISPQDVKFISPKPVVPNSPAPLQERKRFIEHIVTILLKVNPRLRTPKRKAMQIEYEVAQSASSATYGTLIRQRIHKLSHPEKYKAKPKVPTREEQLELLRKWSISPEKLEKFGFVMNIPKVEESQPPVLARKCCRCGSQFQVSEQLEPVKCHYHYGKIRRKQDRSRYHECCRAEENQNPCAVADHHVYMFESIQEKHQAVPYQFTRDLFKTGGQPQYHPVLGIDCEMGFTTKGFELMRITAVDYFTNATVLDVYVLPFGDVVDLNTRFSGISEINNNFISFEDSMKKLGEVMDMNTILIGHGLENDMNAMRLIHDKIIDTSILYPKFQPSPTFRWSLKDLTFKFLSRNIQIGEHDSTEDSIAAIDIVKHFVNKELTSNS
ncbi:RNA exonuclease 3 [Spathaspora sp. JA1]|nr:RNA exonuclease 3 [Spathaspora sp. JA1]